MKKFVLKIIAQVLFSLALSKGKKAEIHVDKTL